MQGEIVLISPKTMPPAYSRVATPICSIVNLVVVRSVLFFDMEVIIWVYSACYRNCIF